MPKWTRWVARGAAGVLGLALVAAAAVYAASEMRLRRTYDVAVRPLAFRADSATLARGRHVAGAIGKCADCHGDDLGGKVFIDDAMLGRVVASNLTPGRGGLADLSDGELDRAIRHGVAADGRPLLFMPSNEFHHLSDADGTALIAYLRSVPAVDRELPASTVGPMGRTLYLAGQLPLLAAERIDHTARRGVAPPAGATVEYGAYLATVGGCTGCHGAELVGGPIPGTPPEWPPASNLTPAGLGAWSEADFFRALREGRRPDGAEISPFMPWKRTAEMTDEEIRAVWLFLRSVPARETPAKG